MGYLGKKPADIDVDIDDASITATELAADSVDSSELVDGSIDTSHIADNQVTLAKMAGLARGKIIYGDASGDPAALTVGSNGQVLTSDGTDISWGSDAKLTTEEVQDIAGAMFSSNTETGITATYQDGDGTIDLAVGSITSAMITDGTIATADIADDAVTSDKLDTNIAIGGTLGVTGAITGTLGTAAQTNITSLGTLTALTVDDITINGSTISDAGDLTLDVAGRINLDADTDGDVRFKDGGTQYGQIFHTGSDMYIRSCIDDEDMVFQGYDNGSTITALTLDMSDAGTATFNHDVVVSGNLNFGNPLTLQASGNDAVVTNTTGNMYLQTDSTLRIADVGNNETHAIFNDNGAVTLYYDNSSKLSTSATGATLSGNLTMTSGVVYASQVYVADRLGHLDDASTFIDFDTDTIKFATDGEAMRIDSSGNIGFGTTTLPTGMANSSYKQIKIGGGILADSGHASGHNIVLGNNVYIGSGNDAKFTHAAAASMINMSSGDINFRTHDGGGASADATASLTSRLYIKENGQIGIGNQTSPSYRLDINASGSPSAFRVANSTNGQDLNCAISNSGTSSGDDALLAISTTNGAGDPYIRMSIAGVEDWHIGVDNSDADNLHIGRNSSIGSGTKMVLGNDIAMKAGGATGQTHLKFNNSQATVADDALIDISGVLNTGALVAVSSRYRGASVVYCQALYYVDYRSSTAPVLLADPSDAFHNGDVDGKNCLFMNGNANLRYKNRNGITNYVAISIIQFQGN